MLELLDKVVDKMVVEVLQAGPASITGGGVGASNVWDVQETQDVQETWDMQEMQDMQETWDVQETWDMQETWDVQETWDMQEMRDDKRRRTNRWMRRGDVVDTLTCIQHARNTRDKSTC